MKNFKKLLFMLAVVLTAAVTFTSCNSDNNDYYIDQTQQKQYMTMMANSYVGKMRSYYFDYQKQKYIKYDSVSTSWNVRSDSTLTLRNFPINTLDSAIYVPETETGAEATTLRELQKAISKVKTPVDIKCYYYVPTTAFVNNTAMSFIVNPVYFKQTLTYNGATHDVYFVFLTNAYGGTYYMSNQSLEFNMFLQSFSIDKEPRDFTNSVSSRYFRNVLFTCTAK